MGPPNVHGEQGVEKGEDMQIPGAAVSPAPWFWTSALRHCEATDLYDPKLLRLGPFTLAAVGELYGSTHTQVLRKSPGGTRLNMSDTKVEFGSPTLGRLEGKEETSQTCFGRSLSFCLSGKSLFLVRISAHLRVYSPSCMHVRCFGWGVDTNALWSARRSQKLRLLPRIRVKSISL